MKMEYWITNNDMNIWKSIPDDHVADFHYMDDARDIWNAVKARFGGNAKSKNMRKSMLKQEFLEFIIGEAEGLHKGSQDAGDAREFALMGVTFEVHNCPFGCDKKYNELKKQYNELNEQHNEYFIQVQAYKNSLKTLEKQKRVLQRNQLTLEDKIRVLSIELENTSNLLNHSERINSDVETAKKDLQEKLDNHLVLTEKWRNSSKNLFRLVDSSMSVRTKVRLGFTDCVRENKLGWDDSAFSVFTTNSEDVEGRPIFHRFAKTDSMKVVPPPLTRDYTSLSDHTDLDESQMSYCTKSSTFCDPKCVPNGVVSCNDSDKSSEVNTNDLPSSDSSIKSSEHKPTDSSCASTSSVNIPPARPQPVPTGKPKVTPVPTSKPKVTPVSTSKPKVKPVLTGKPKVTPVPTGKPQVSTPVPTGRPNRPFPVPTDR
nr:xylulose kinase-1 [Tanacetum cinerariifolium]